MLEFKFQDYILLEVESNGRTQYDNYFSNEYTRVEVANERSGAPKCVVRLEIVKEFPELPSNAIIRSEDFKNLFNYEFAIVGLDDDKTTIYFKSHPISNLYVTAIGVFIQAQVLEPILYYTFLQKNVLFMHCAGVSKNGLAYLFPAHGGTGKTTTCLALMGKGFDFMGDDLLLVDVDQKQVFPYPRPLHLFTYNVKNLHGARLPVSLVSKIYFKNIIRLILEKILKTDFLISTRAHADHLFSDFSLSKSARLNSLTFLKKEGESKKISIQENDDITEHARNIIESADLNESLYRFISKNEVLSTLKDKEIKLASAMLLSSNSFRYLNVRKIDLDEIEKHIGAHNES